jgi:hypothetical protein
MRLKWILATLSAFILLPVLLLIAVLVFLDTADLNRHRDFIAGQVSALMGRRLSLDGELELNLGEKTSVLITDIALANASWASKPEMLSIERMEAEIELLPLLRGDIHIPRFHVHGVKTSLETSQEGSGNWVMSQPQVDDDVPAGDRGAADLKLPWLGDVQLSGIEVIYLDGQTGQRVSAILDHARLGAATPESPTEFDVAGRVNDEPVEINGKIAIPARLATDHMEFPLELHARVLDINAQASGRITGELESPAINLDVDVNAANLNQLRQVFGDAVPLVDNVSLAMKVAGEQGRPVTMKLKAAASDAQLDTRLTLHRDGPRPRLVASIDLARLDVVQMWASYFSGEPAQKKTAPPLSAQPEKPYSLDQPIALEWLEAFDADIVITTNDINLPQMRISHFQSRFMIDDRLLTVEDTKLDTDAGAINVKFSLDGRDKQPNILLALDTTDVALDRVKALADNDRTKGSSASAAVSLATQGNSVVRLVDALTGNIELKYSNKKLRDKLALKLTRQAANKSVRPPLLVSASGVVDGHAVKLGGKVTYPAQVLLSKKPSKIDLDVQALGVKGKIKGTVPHTLDAADLDIDAQADSLAKLKQVFGQGVPAIGKTALQARLAVQQSKLRVSNMLVSLDKGRIEGWTALDTSGSKPDLKAELAFSDLDLDKLMPAKDETSDAKPAQAKAKAKAKDRLLPDDALPFESLSRVNMQTSLHVTNLVYNNRRLSQADININLTDGKLAASLLRLASARGELLADLVVDASGSKKPTVMLKLKAAQIELGELLATLDGTAPIEGPMSTDIVLQGQGNSVAEITGSLNGHVNLLLEQGTADARALDLFVGGLSAMFGTIFIDQSPKTAIHCAICDLKFNNGLMTSELAVLDTQYSTVFLEGQVNLKSEQLDLKVSPEAKGVTLSVAFPVLVKGKLDAPNIDVEKKGALIKTGELWATVVYPPAALLKFDDLVGDGKQNPCVSMVAEKGGIPFVEDVGKVVKGAVKGTGKVVGGTVEGTEKAIKGVGGVLKDAGSGLGKIFDRKEDDADAGSDNQQSEEDDFDMDF